MRWYWSGNGYFPLRQKLGTGLQMPNTNTALQQFTLQTPSVPQTQGSLPRRQPSMFPHLSPQSTPGATRLQWSVEQGQREKIKETRHIADER